MSTLPPDVRRVLDGDEVERALRRMALEIAERNRGVGDIALVGVRRGGIAPAARLCALLREGEGREVPVGSVDITLYRDDAATALPNPRIGPSEIHFEVDGRVVVLVDDVVVGSVEVVVPDGPQVPLPSQTPLTVFATTQAGQARQEGP
jgi:pyrimidine operon attenuation protein/uracil phosphoribosyltransferase